MVSCEWAVCLKAGSLKVSVYWTPPAFIISWLVSPVDITIMLAASSQHQGLALCSSTMVCNERCSRHGSTLQARMILPAGQGPALLNKNMLLCLMELFPYSWVSDFHGSIIFIYSSMISLLKPFFSIRLTLFSCSIDCSWYTDVGKYNIRMESVIRQWKKKVGWEF